MGQKLNGPLIRALRKSTGQRQEDLAELAGISIRSVGDAERGKAVGIDVCTRLAKALLVDPADQLFAAKGLRLDQLRRASDPDSARAVGPQTTAEIGRVQFSHLGRRNVRLFLLDRLTPTSGYTLQDHEVTLFQDSMERWSRDTFEGFAAACLFYLSYESASSETGEAGNITTLINSCLMAKHCFRLERTGEGEEEAGSLAAGCGEFVTEIWDQWNHHAAGVIADKQHLYCPPGEKKAYYRGWLECCTWLTGNASKNIEIERERSVREYQDIVIELVRAALGYYEEVSVPGTSGFWLFVLYFLRREFGEAVAPMDEADWRRSHPHSFEDVMRHIVFLLELNTDALAGFRDLVNSFEEGITGYQVALLKLRSEFMYTGTQDGEVYMIDAVRVPRS